MTEQSVQNNLETKVKSRYRDLAIDFSINENLTTSCCVQSPNDSCSTNTTSDTCCGDPSTVTRDNMSLGCDLRLLDIANPQKGEVVIDLGSGPGTDTRKVSKLIGAEGEVIGIDFLPEMIELAKSNAIEYDNIRYVLSDIRKIKLTDTLADLIISNCVFNLIDDKEEVFREAYRLLRKGGRIVISDMITDDPNAQITDSDMCACIGGSTSIEEYIDMMTKIGFKNPSYIKEYESTYSGELDVINYQSVLFIGYK